MLPLWYSKLRKNIWFGVNNYPQSFVTRPFLKIDRWDYLLFVRVVPGMPYALVMKNQKIFKH